MKKYDVIVIGGGDVGTGVVFRALSSGAKVALVEKGKIGGTCLNVGCVPSKTLIEAADAVMAVHAAQKLGVEAEIKTIHFSAIMERMRRTVKKGRESLEAALRDSEDLDIYAGQAAFSGDLTVEVNGGERMTGEKIFIAAGARPAIPPIKGIEKTGYLTNETVLDLQDLPERMAIIGGGYVGVEYAHFFSAMGTKVRLLQRGPRLVPNEEPEISDQLKAELSKRMEVYTGVDVEEARQNGKGVAVRYKDAIGSKEVFCEKLFIATGRVSNAESLRPDVTGVELNESKFVLVNDYLETTRKNIWALGDVIGRQMFTHAGDREAEIVWKNATASEKEKMDFFAVPHAIFTHPQIASVGLTEEAARKGGDIRVGKARYADTVKGSAMMEETGLAKAILAKDTDRILGFHIAGPEAAILIQEVANALAAGGDRSSILRHMHIFPALSDVVVEALGNAR